MKQTRPAKPDRARLTALSQQDLCAVAGGHNGTIIVESLLGISGSGVVGDGISGSG